MKGLTRMDNDFTVKDLFPLVLFCYTEVSEKTFSALSEHEICMIEKCSNKLLNKIKEKTNG